MQFFNKIKTIEYLEVLNKDRYGRYIVDVAYNKQRSISEALLIHGLAWHYKKYSKDPALQALENQAGASKRGLWQDSQAIAPWEWRSKKRKKTPKKYVIIRIVMGAQGGYF